MKSIKKIIKRLCSLGRNSNLKNQLTTDFQRVTLDNRTLKKFPPFLQYSLPAFFAKVDYMDSSTVIVKVVYLERREKEIVDVEKEFFFDIDKINFLEIETN